MERTSVGQGERSPVSVLIVGRNRRNLELLQGLLETEGYQVQTADDPAVLARLVEEGNLSLALVDLAGFDQGVWGPCERLRSQGIPFLLISSRQSAAVQEAGLSKGARGVLVKPLEVRHLLALVRELFSA